MIYYIYNPLAKSVNAGTLIKKKNYSQKYALNNETEMNKLLDIVKKEDILYLLGGDGTLQHFIDMYPSLLNNEIKYYPLGSANDFAQTLKDKYPYVYKVTTSDQQSHSFINGMGLGFDALVCKKVNNLKSKSRLSYLVESFKGVMEYKPFDITVKYDGKVKTFNKVWLCSLQNGPYFGGGFKITKDADITDSKIDFAVANNINRFTVILILLFVRLGQVHRLKKYFHSEKISEFEIIDNKKLLAQFDGNTFDINTPCHISSCKKVKITKTSQL
ncbi:diacylglycerol/lipid kinase family protein [Mycoplasma sp. P36-A1]|uniref:diacylglycerol/lipid kinase family protein n=1 Tax=Mycoplasma sp. P36-A1 TaxID=3252900 RepID=UPI003C30B4BB